MAPALTLYTHPMSRGRVARWMLEECGVRYDSVLLDYGTSMKAPDYLAINPMGKVPALQHGATVVTENAAICAYLADLFPEKQLAPAVGSAARGSYYRWLFFAAGPAEAATTAKTMNLLAPPDKAMQAGYGTYADVLSTLETAVSRGPYLCGDHFTAADLYVAAFLHWGMQFGGIDKRPAFERYTLPIVQRDACLRASAIDDALLAKQPGPR
ncbi:glutathione S-transferase family protein [Polaromonas sp. SM01]|uniref:glutathione S-transferase family protein n=1 Tax=Polaromonas sp. SM01 TaxID=3085630 RepID=UPI0029825C85|nr:glutathione S-transferase family protein [Polaromonas sp. SM01]MDW5441506.1 glutathione S-transferase family protein [Polaromonas sp. SM01]